MSGEVKQNTSVATGVIATAPSATQSGSNPTTSTNPESVGAEWHNTTTGQIFICSNNTTNENVWYGQRGIIKQVNDRGVIGGGSFTTLDYVTIQTTGNASTFGNLSVGRAETAEASGD